MKILIIGVLLLTTTLCFKVSNDFSHFQGGPNKCIGDGFRQCIKEHATLDDKAGLDALRQTHPQSPEEALSFINEASINADLKSCFVDVFQHCAPPAKLFKHFKQGPEQCFHKEVGKCIHDKATPEDKKGLDDLRQTEPKSAEEAKSFIEAAAINDGLKTCLLGALSHCAPPAKLFKHFKQGPEECFHKEVGKCIHDKATPEDKKGLDDLRQTEPKSAEEAKSFIEAAAINDGLKTCLLGALDHCAPPAKLFKHLKQGPEQCFHNEVTKCIHEKAVPEDRQGFEDLTKTDPKTAEEAKKFIQDASISEGLKTCLLGALDHCAPIKALKHQKKGTSFKMQIKHNNQKCFEDKIGKCVHDFSTSNDESALAQLEQDVQSVQSIDDLKDVISKSEINENLKKCFLGSIDICAPPEDIAQAKCIDDQIAERKCPALATPADEEHFGEIDEQLRNAQSLEEATQVIAGSKINEKLKKCIIDSFHSCAAPAPKIRLSKFKSTYTSRKIQKSKKN